MTNNNIYHCRLIACCETCHQINDGNKCLWLEPKQTQYLQVLLFA